MLGLTRRTCAGASASDVSADCANYAASEREPRPADIAHQGFSSETATLTPRADARHAMAASSLSPRSPSVPELGWGHVPSTRSARSDGVEYVKYQGTVQ